MVDQALLLFAEALIPRTNSCKIFDGVTPFELTVAFAPAAPPSFSASSVADRRTKRKWRHSHQHHAHPTRVLKSIFAGNKNDLVCSTVNVPSPQYKLLTLAKMMPVLRMMGGKCTLQTKYIT